MNPYSSILFWIVILSPIISFLAYFLKDIYIQQWKNKLETKIETLQAQNSQVNSLITNFANSISSLHLSSNQKRIECLEYVWESMIEIKKELPSVVFLLNTILTKDEYQKILTTENNLFKELIQSFDPNHYVNFIAERSKKIEKMRPFIGDQIWVTYFTYQAFLARITVLLELGRKKGTMTHWHDDSNFTNQILSSVINEIELNQILNSNKGFEYLLSFIEMKVVNNISEQISGKKISEETLAHAILLSKLYQENNDLNKA